MEAVVAPAVPAVAVLAEERQPAQTNALKDGKRDALAQQASKYAEYIMIQTRAWNGILQNHAREILPADTAHARKMKNRIGPAKTMNAPTYALKKQPALKNMRRTMKKNAVTMTSTGLTQTA